MPGVNVGPNDGVPTPPTVAKANAKAPPGMTATATNSPKTGERNTGQTDEYVNTVTPATGATTGTFGKTPTGGGNDTRPLDGPKR